jgi:hypothetical protein
MKKQSKEKPSKEKSSDDLNVINKQSQISQASLNQSKLMEIETIVGISIIRRISETEYRIE